MVLYDVLSECSEAEGDRYSAEGRRTDSALGFEV